VSVVACPTLTVVAGASVPVGLLTFGLTGTATTDTYAAGFAWSDESGATKEVTCTTVEDGQCTITPAARAFDGTVQPQVTFKVTVDGIASLDCPVTVRRNLVLWMWVCVW